MVYLIGTGTVYIDKLRTAIQCKYHSAYRGFATPIPRRAFVKKRD